MFSNTKLVFLGKKINSEADYIESMKEDIYFGSDPKMPSNEVEQLQLTSCIVNELPDFKKYSNLKKITFNNCIFLNKPFLNKLEKSLKLEELEIKNCTNSIFLPKALELLPKLKSICIENSNIEFINHCDFNKIKNLTELFLINSCSFNSYPITLEVTSPTLKVLTIAECKLSSINFDVNSCVLEKIYLNNNRLDMIQSNIFSLKKLDSLSIQYNCVDDLSNLSTKDINHKVLFNYLNNPIKDINPDILINSYINTYLPTNSVDKSINVNLYPTLMKTKNKAIDNIALGVNVKQNKLLIKKVNEIFQLTD